MAVLPPRFNTVLERETYYSTISERETRDVLEREERDVQERDKRRTYKREERRTRERGERRTEREDRQARSPREKKEKGVLMGRERADDSGPNGFFVLWRSCWKIPYQLHYKNLVEAAVLVHVHALESARACSKLTQACPVHPKMPKEAKLYKT